LLDVVVIGGGPAGSTVSTLLAQQGCRVELFERERFPRFHIGESLIPETYWVLKRLNMLPKMQASHFVKKYSVQFVNASGKLSAPFYFWDNKPHECSQTWQVVRSEFDQMMLENAREHGVVAHEGVRVMDVLFEGDRAVGVTVREADGSIREVRAKVVVDASGQSGLIQNRLRLRIWDPLLNKGAIWTYWEGAHRAPHRAPRSLGTVRCSSTRRRRPDRSASASTGTSPAADTRFGSSNAADDRENVWQSLTCWMPFAVDRPDLQQARSSRGARASRVYDAFTPPRSSVNPGLASLVAVLFAAGAIVLAIRQAATANMSTTAGS
jgi:hypothetical protein